MIFFTGGKGAGLWPALPRLAAIGLFFWAGSLFAQGTFGSGLYQVMEKAGCRACHNPDGVASGTRLHFPDADASPEKIEAFGNSLVVLVDREHPELSVLLRKPTARIAHTGGERIKPGSPEEVLLKGWIDHLAQLSGVDLSNAMRYKELEDRAPGPLRRMRSFDD